MNLALLGAIAIVVFGCVQTAGAAWGIVEEGWPRSLLFQGMLLIELGLAFVALAVLSPGVMRSSIAGAFIVSGIWTGITAHRLMRAERREQQGGTHGGDG